MQDDILPDGQPLEEFPRIWVLALSKADLLPDLDVHEFQSLIIHKAADEVAALSDTLKEFVQVPEALSLGEDFLVLSSAKFEPGKIDVTTRRGLDLILPVASLLPLERLGQWFDKLDVPLKVLGKLVDNADTLAVVLAGAGAGVVGKLLGKVPKVGKILGPVAVPALAEAAQFSAAKLRETHSQALENRDYATAMLTEFRLDLDRGVDEGLLSKCQW